MCAGGHGVLLIAVNYTRLSAGFRRFTCGVGDFALISRVKAAFIDGNQLEWMKNWMKSTSGFFASFSVMPA
jgi:hypothetical protein